MKTRLSMMLAVVCAATFAFTAAAQPAGGGPGKGPGARPLDCAKFKDKARCEALNKDIEACRDKVGDDWRRCMHQPLPSGKYAPPKVRDCSRAHNKELCEAHNVALETCKDRTTRAEHRKCMAAQLPAAADGKR